jgi:hypothetical protein
MIERADYVMCQSRRKYGGEIISIVVHACWTLAGIPTAQYLNERKIEVRDS